MNSMKEMLSQLRVQKPDDFGRVAVLMGGSSSERDISLLSGNAVYQSLIRNKIDATKIDVGNSIPDQLANGRFDRALIILHGRGGEDGVIQGVLEMLGLPYTGSGIVGSAVAMDKLRSKYIWGGIGLPTPEFISVNSKSDITHVTETFEMPVVIKPINEGSSIGMSKVEKRQDLVSAWETAHRYDHEVIVERWIKGKEYTAAILDGVVLPLIEIKTERIFYDYRAKYNDDTTQYICPCGLPAELEKKLKLLALKAFEALGCSGWGRVDMMCDSNKQPWLLEVNTVPGMTDHSLVPMAAEAAGISFDELVWRILQTSIKNERNM